MGSGVRQADDAGGAAPSGTVTAKTLDLLGRPPSEDEKIDQSNLGSCDANERSRSRGLRV